jgi:sterol desaturase/sphingolipid hydroxylase (fatty acid hydroxylase superfamily)
MTHDTRPVFDTRDLSEFHRAFARLTEIRLYAAIATACALFAAWRAENLWQIVVPALAVLVAFPVLEYVIHRYILHNKTLCRTALTARIWWRIHYRHHAEPNDAEVILGAPVSLIVAALAASAAIAVPMQSLAAFAAALATGMLCAIVYEYFHSLHHAQVEIASPYLVAMRRHHLLHHHLEEKGNFGITSPLIDFLCGTKYERETAERSPTVRNLGYAGALREQYPYIARMEPEAGAPRSDAPAR